MHGKTPYTPLTQEEQRFASENHGLVFQYLRRRKLDPDEWYDVVIFRFLLAVKKWFARPELHKWSFSTIACQGMRSAIGAELDKQKRRIRTISLEELVPGTEDVTWMDTITEENLKFVNYMEEDMNISYNDMVPERKRWNGGKKSDEVAAIETFLAGKMKNMRIEYDTTEEAKRRLGTLQCYRRKNNLKEVLDIFREEKDIYVVKIKEAGK